MRLNLFINLSNKDLKDCFHSYIRVQSKSKEEKEKMIEDYKDREFFLSCVDEYIWDLEERVRNFKHYDNNKKYLIGSSNAERDLLYTMARRYLKLCDILNEVKPFFDECID